MDILFLLFVAFQIKHFICDYPLQNSYMLGKSKHVDWVKPLSVHCLVHAAFTLIICLLFDVDVNKACFLAVLDFSVHFVMDRVKASPKMLGRYKQDNPKFWYSLGFDQMIHHLTHYLIIFLILK